MLAVKGLQLGTGREGLFVIIAASGLAQDPDGEGFHWCL
jgi:hypothetical protein